MKTRLAALSVVAALVVASAFVFGGASPAQAGVVSSLLTINPMSGSFYEYDETYPAPDPGAFDPQNLKTTPFATGTYPALDFNPTEGSPIVDGCNNVPPGFQFDYTIPFENVEPGGGGACSFVPVPGAGDTHPQFEATFTGTVTAPARGIYSLRVESSDGWIIGMGTRIGGTQRALKVAGPLVNAPTRTAVSKLPVIAAYNQGQDPFVDHVLAFFPAAGDYPFEANYVKAQSSPRTFTVIPEEAAPATVMVSPVQMVYDGDSGSGRSIRVQIQLSRPVDTPVSVDWMVSDGTAINGQDYKLRKTSGTVTFKPTSSGLSPVNKSLVIPIITPKTTPDDPYMFAELSNPQGGVELAPDDFGTPTIIGTDLAAPAPRVGVAPFTAAFSGLGKIRNALVPVTLSAPQAVPVTVRVDTESCGCFAEGINYRGVHKTLTFNPGQVQKLVSIPLYVYDTVSSGDIELHLSDPSGGLALSDYGFGPGVGLVEVCACSGPNP